jgi:hypothetical protein
MGWQLTGAVTLDQSLSCDIAGCSGKRSRTAHVRLGAFSERELVSDYRLLEEALLAAESAKRSRQRLIHDSAEACGSVPFLLQQARGCMPPHQLPHASFLGLRHDDAWHDDDHAWPRCSQHEDGHAL